MILFAPGAQDDLERIFEFNLDREPSSALAHIELIRSAVMMLDEHPQLGRRVGRSSLRELVISRGRTGYVAAYEYSAAEGLIRIVAIRHQREAGYRGE